MVTELEQLKSETLFLREELDRLKSRLIGLEAKVPIGGVIIWYGDQDNLLEGFLPVQGGTYRRIDYPLLWEHMRDGTRPENVTDDSFTLVDLGELHPRIVRAK